MRDNSKYIIQNTRKQIRGNVWVGVLLFLVVLTTVGLALISDSIVTLSQSKRQEQVIAAQSICDGGIEKAAWELNHTAGAYTGETGTNMSGVGVLDIKVTTVDADDKTIIATAYVPNKSSPKKVTRKVKAKMHISYDIVSFNYALQLGDQGLTLADWAQVNGSVYTSGNIISNSWGFWTGINGDAYTSGAGTKIQSTYINGNAHSHTLQSNWITHEAFYKTLSGTNWIWGAKHPNSADPVDVGLAVTNSMITQWKQDIVDDPTTTTFTGNKVINGNQTQTLGPMIITGDLTIEHGNLIMKGPIWVKGKVIIQNGATVKLDTTYLTKSGMLITDGTILINSGVYIQGNPLNNQSYIMLITTAAPTLPTPAIDVWWGDDTTVAYCAPNGTVNIEALVRLRAVSARGLNMMYGVVIDYISGMASLDIATGPGASWQIKEWQVCTGNISCN
jgi:hypothetical protein